MKLRCAVSPRLVLKVVKIARSVAKVGLHPSLSNGHPNLWSNFNSKKLVKSETPSCIFARVGLKGVQIAQNIAKVGVHVFISNGHPNIWSNFNFEKLFRRETSSFIFARVGLEGVKIARTVAKVGVHVFYMKRASKSMIKFQLQEFAQKWNSII